MKLVYMLPPSNVESRNDKCQEEADVETGLIKEELSNIHSVGPQLHDTRNRHGDDSSGAKELKGEKRGNCHKNKNATELSDHHSYDESEDATHGQLRVVELPTKRFVMDWFERRNISLESRLSQCHIVKDDRVRRGNRTNPITSKSTQKQPQLGSTRLLDSYPGNMTVAHPRRLKQESQTRGRSKSRGRKEIGRNSGAEKLVTQSSTKHI